MIRNLYVYNLLIASWLILDKNEATCFQFPFTLSIIGGLNNKPLSRKSFGEFFPLGGAIIVSSLIHKEQAEAAWFEGKERRQLDLCVVNVLRALYWAELESSSFEAAAGSEDRRKELYLESRLSAKALVTGKIGGGASNRVYILATLKLRDCLDDLVFYSTSTRVVSGLSEDLLESLASLVEFDGLETTQDPSPRSALMLSMYNKDKETFVRRMLKDRIITTAKTIVASVDPDVRHRCEAYVLAAYPNEVPKNSDLTVSVDTAAEY
jgi:hypothetical protein